MEKTRLEAGIPVEVAGVKIIPVTSVSLNHGRIDGAHYFLASKKPVDVIVVSESAKRAFTVTGKEVSLESLFNEVPGLRDSLKDIL